MELSLLREFVYVIGSSAFSSSLIISVFLGGLAVGTYFGIWKRYTSKDETAARIKFAVLQLILIVFISLFYVTKDYFVYICPNQALVVAYFIIATFLPSFLSGASYSTMVEILYHKGERHVVYIYAVSTLGSVVGGLVYGYVFVYLVGIQASYACAALCSTLAIALVYPFAKKAHTVGFFFVALFVPFAIQGNYVNNALYRFHDLLFKKYSPFGLVEVWRMNDGRSVELNVNNVHQYYSYDWDNRVHAQWSETTLGIVDRPSDALLLGYGSGISSAAFLKSDKTTSVDSIENCEPVLEAGKRFFPDEYRLVTTDPRSRIILQDFRNYIRFTDKKYDIVLLDHSILDPYYGGFFTVDFFDQLKRILKPHGVIAILGIGLSWDTTQSSFTYVYKYSAPGEPLISKNGYFLSVEPFDPKVAWRYTRVEEETGKSPVYSDHRIFGNSFQTAMRVVR